MSSKMNVHYLIVHNNTCSYSSDALGNLGMEGQQEELKMSELGAL